MIGDSKVDYLAAFENGMDFILRETKFNELLQENIAVKIKSFNELVEKNNDDAKTNKSTFLS